MDIVTHVSSAVDRVVAVIRAPAAAEARVIALGLYEAGLRDLEFTMTIPDVLPVVVELVQVLPEARIGVGTIRSEAELEGAVASGARFCVSPVLDTGVLGRANELDVPFIAGALTPSEIVAAASAGATAVKIFPIEAVGGARYLAAVHEVFPEVACWVSGSIALDDVDAYAAAGATRICIGGALIDRAAARASDTGQIAAYARAAIDGVQLADTSGAR